MKNSVTVVLATYNGQKFIEEQLNSIIKQTVAINEVIISDDGSKDGTVSICQEFVRKHNLKDWIIIENKGKHGSYENFWNGLKRTSGEYIVLCDQDDIWLHDKIERMLKCFEEKQDMLGLASTFSRFNESGVICKHQNHPHIKKGGLKKITIEEFAHFHEYLGMSMMIRKPIVDEFNKYAECVPMLHKSHDIILSFFSTINGGFYFLDQALTKRRSYKESTSNRLGNKEFNESGYKKKNAYRYALKAEYMNAFSVLTQLSEKDYLIKDFEKYKSIFYSRANYINNADLLLYIKNINHIRCYDGMVDYLKDLYRIFSDK